MVFAIATFITALSISCVGAYFSILGLATIFPGSPIAVVVMGIVLEIGKLMTAVWLHRNWKATNFLLKSYLTFAVLVLMGITSMGIFGFLSKSHIEHQAQATHEITLMQTLDAKMNQEAALIKQYEAYIESCQKRLASSGTQSNTEIEREEKRITQLLSTLENDISIEQGRIDKLTARRQELDTAVAALESTSGGLFSSKKKKLEELRAQQSTEREEISGAIKKYNSNIESFRTNTNSEVARLRESIDSFRNQGGSNLTEIQGEIEKTNAQIRECMDRSTEYEKEKLQYGEKIRALEAEIGPLKFVAEAVKDFGGDEVEADRAVRFIIIILMIVFDPLAILLVIAANISLSKAFKKPYPKLSEQINTNLPTAPLPTAPPIVAVKDPVDPTPGPTGDRGPKGDAGMPPLSEEQPSDPPPSPAKPLTLQELVSPAVPPSGKKPPRQGRPAPWDHPEEWDDE